LLGALLSEVAPAARNSLCARFGGYEESMPVYRAWQLNKETWNILDPVTDITAAIELHTSQSV
jgi:hypothetical protein